MEKISSVHINGILTTPASHAAQGLSNTVVCLPYKPKAIEGHLPPSRACATTAATCRRRVGGGGNRVPLVPVFPLAQPRGGRRPPLFWRAPPPPVAPHTGPPTPSPIGGWETNPHIRGGTQMGGLAMGKCPKPAGNREMALCAIEHRDRLRFHESHSMVRVYVPWIWPSEWSTMPSKSARDYCLVPNNILRY